MTKSRWIIFTVICAFILGLIILTSKKQDQTVTSSTTYKGNASQVISNGPIPDHVLGNTDHKVILLQYGDFECPGCEALYPSLKQLVNKYSADLTFVFREFPLTTIHPNALAAATVAEAAGLQGKFWQMHDALYDNQSSWGESGVTERTQFFNNYAKQLGLNMDKFNNDLTSNAVADKIARDQSTAKTWNVDSTPTLILDGELLPSETALNPTNLQKAIVAELQKQGFTNLPQ